MQGNSILFSLCVISSMLWATGNERKQKKMWWSILCKGQCKLKSLNNSLSAVFATYERMEKKTFARTICLRSLLSPSCNSLKNNKCADVLAVISYAASVLCVFVVQTALMLLPVCACMSRCIYACCNCILLLSFVFTALSSCISSLFKWMCCDALHF